MEDVFLKLEKVLPKDTAVFGSGTDPNILESCGIADADVVAAVTGADEANLVASTISKFEFGVPRVIARVNNPKNVWLFNSGMGVDVGLNMADLMAHLVVEEMDLKNMLTLMKLSHGNYSIVEFTVDDKSKAVNQVIKDLNIPAKAVMIALYRGNDVIIPRGSTTILSGDRILAFTDEDAQIKLNLLFTQG
ncbi:Trk system potassium uptake protein TrkA [bioreactor metagenome]|uniref:Trk system potassium uptake protein TrkA n=1 Tax=bioreactor metagenome TaxID=1076179 RepID=A0A645H2S9_9ZZZZ